MKFTQSLNKGIKKIKMANNIWRHRGKYKDPKLNIPPAIQKLDVEIIDPVEEMKPVRNEKWEPPADDKRFWKPLNPTEHPLYNEKPALLFTYNTKLIQQTQQVCILTKSQMFEGLPANVSKLVNKVNVPDKETKLQQYIMHAYEWNNSKLLQPRRFDYENLRFKFPREYGIPRVLSMRILLADLVRLCQSTAAQFPDAITDRRLIHTPYVNTNYTFKGELIILRGKISYLLGSNKDLQPFADQEAVDQSTLYTMPDLFPVDPTIDLIKEHIYTDTIDTGFKLPYAFSRPHTIFMTNNDHWKEENRQCRALMYCFMYALSRAREKFGQDIINLPEPISVQCVNLSDTALNFTCFQLNTLNFDNDQGIKNFVWFDTGNQLFSRHLPQPWKEDEFYHKRRYENFNPAPFDKMLALILNGLPVSAEL